MISLNFVQGLPRRFEKSDKRKKNEFRIVYKKCFFCRTRYCDSAGLNITFIEAIGSPNLPGKGAI